MGRVLFIGLIVLLLGIQLTGLSCLGEWPNLNSQASGSALVADQAGDDGCPCHLAFVSLTDAIYLQYSPATRIAVAKPPDYAFSTLALPFRPPLS